MKIDEEVLKQLKMIGRTNHWDVIEIISSLNGRPVYRLRNSRIPKGAKTGRPHLYSVTADGIVFELDSKQIHEVIVSYSGLCKRVQ
ncbi:MAG: hypothetical protein IK092_07400 [Muribaculaceae bacterium]|nr:hypothetical protein [Muribaculaceae bacterium]